MVVPVFVAIDTDGVRVAPTVIVTWLLAVCGDTQVALLVMVTLNTSLLLIVEVA